MEGFVTIRTTFGGYSKVWMVLDCQQLSYYEDFDLPNQCPKKLKGSMNVRDAEIKKFSDDNSNIKHGLKIKATAKGGKVSKLQCVMPDAPTCSSWYNSLNRAINLHKEDEDRMNRPLEFKKTLQIEDKPGEKLTQGMIAKAYKKLCLSAHPDKGGDPAVFNQIRHAYTELMAIQQMSDERDNTIALQYEALVEKVSGLGLGISVVEDKLKRQIVVSSVNDKIRIHGITEDSHGEIKPGDILVGIDHDDCSLWWLSRIRARLDNYRIPMNDKVLLTFERRIHKDDLDGYLQKSQEAVSGQNDSDHDDDDDDDEEEERDSQGDSNHDDASDVDDDAEENTPHSQQEAEELAERKRRETEKKKKDPMENESSNVDEELQQQQPDIIDRKKEFLERRRRQQEKTDQDSNSPIIMSPHQPILIPNDDDSIPPPAPPLNISPHSQASESSSARGPPVRRTSLHLFDDDGDDGNNEEGEIEVEYVLKEDYDLQNTELKQLKIDFEEMQIQSFSMGERISELENHNAHLQACCEELQASNEHLKAENEVLRKENDNITYQYASVKNVVDSQFHTMTSQNMKNYLLILQQKVLDFDEQQRELLHRLEKNNTATLSQDPALQDQFRRKQRFQETEERAKRLEEKLQSLCQVVSKHR